jgi:hypothetical protein
MYWSARVLLLHPLRIESRSSGRGSPGLTLLLNWIPREDIDQIESTSALLQLALLRKILSVIVGDISETRLLQECSGRGRMGLDLLLHMSGVQDPRVVQSLSGTQPSGWFHAKERLHKISTCSRDFIPNTAKGLRRRAREGGGGKYPSCME